MITTVHIGDNPVILKSEDFTDELDIDKLTSIDYSNLYGEAVTVSALLNKVGMLKAESESYLSQVTLKVDSFAAELRRKFRRQANAESGKFMQDGEYIKLTEKSLDDAVLLDKEYQTLKKEQFEAKKDLEILDSIFWAVQAKCKKLDNICRPVTPDEFMNELVEGKVNTFIIKKF